MREPDSVQDRERRQLWWLPLHRSAGELSTTSRCFEKYR